LAEGGIDIDSGSACSAADLQPSHVLAAMGYPTTGHVRITLHSGTTHGEIDALKKAISQAIS
jgi:cysteine desulfurase